MSKQNYLQDGLYKELEDVKDTSILFRKFEHGTFIVHYNPMGQQIGMIFISNDNLKAIYNAPEIEIGDGSSPQLLLGDIKFQ